MMRDELDESGSWCNTRLGMELASVLRKRASRRNPITSVARFSNLTEDDLHKATKIKDRELTLSHVLPRWPVFPHLVLPSF